MSFILEVLTELVPGATPDWVHLCTLDEEHAVLAKRAYEAAKDRYERARLKRDDGSVVADSGSG